MKYFIGIIVGYLLGCLSPTYLFSIIKNIDMRKSGTGNLGATNAMLTLGKKFGVIVMIFDIAKAFVPVLIYKLLFPNDHILILTVGLSTVIGHVFPFYLKFKGGKGVATFAGIVLAYNPIMFLILLLLGLCCIFCFNYFFALPISASLLFPVLVGFYTKSVIPTILAAAVGLTVILKHSRNFKRIFDGTEIKFREYFKGKYKIEKVKKKDK